MLLVELGNALDVDERERKRMVGEVFLSQKKKHTVQAMGELTPAVVVLTQRQNHFPPTTL